MTQHHWTNAPTETRAQVTQLCTSMQGILGPGLIGIYLHGSLAMGCFNPLCSDIDLLVVISDPLSSPQTRQAARVLLDLSLCPHPIEISFLTREQLLPWRFPTPYDLHYSENWRERMVTWLAGGDETSLAGMSSADPDLAAHFTILRHRGVILSGPPIDTLFPAVPPHDYMSAIWQHDTADCVEWIASSPVYGVLNLCRVLAYVAVGLIASKDEGGCWALDILPQDDRAMVERALTIYRGEVTDDASEPDATGQSRFDPEELSSFARHMTARIADHIWMQRK